MQKGFQSFRLNSTFIFFSAVPLLSFLSVAQAALSCSPPHTRVVAIMIKKYDKKILFKFGMK